MAGDVRVTSYITTLLFVILHLDRALCDPLYSPDDPIVCLDSTNFRSNITDTENAWFIEFYSSWCGHCIRFAPTWKQLSVDVKGWTDVIKTAGVDCANSNNTALCRENDINAYPTIKFFPARSKKNESGSKYTEAHTIPTMKKAMITYVEAQPADRRGKCWPNFTPLKSLEDLWLDRKPDVKHTVVVFEQHGQYLGKELILDYSGVPALSIRRMMQEDGLKYGIKTVPSLVALEKFGKFVTLAVGQDRAVCQKALNALIGQVRNATNTGSLGRVTGTTSATIWKEPTSVQMQDLESALHYSFRQEIGMRSRLTAGDLVIVKNYVRVLAKYFPGKLHIVNFLKRMDTWLQDKCNITGSQWLKQVNTIKSDAAFLPSKIEWVNCVGSAPRFRGYPCSLWQLFHTLSVEWVRCCSEMKGHSALEVLQAMKGYIGNIFGCKECGKNFLKMSATLRRQVYVADDAIMWLWRAHNRANARLAHDASEDPKHPKIQFPSQRMCPECHSKTNDGSGYYNEINVLTFLKKYYFVPNNRTDHLSYMAQLDRNQRSYEIYGEDRDLVKTEDDSHRNSKLGYARREYLRPGQMVKMPSSWGMSSLDISMCVFLYFTCSGMVIVLYFLVTTRRMGICRKYGLA